MTSRVWRKLHRLNGTRCQFSSVTRASGLGGTVCKAFKAAGAQVVGVDLQGEDCLHLDVGTAEGNRRMMAEAVDRHGRLDILVLNAGAQQMAPIVDYDEAEWDRLMNVMAKG